MIKDRSLLLLLLSLSIINANAIPAITSRRPLVIPTTLITDVTAYGVKGDGLMDDTAALQAAIDAAPPGGIVQIPAAANLKLTGTILVYGKNGLTIEGSQGDAYGKRSPSLTWAGAAGGTMIRWVNNNSSQLSGLFFNMGTASIAVDVDQDQDRQATCSVRAGTKDVTCPDARFKTDATGYKATDVGRTIKIGGIFTTTIANVTSARTATLATTAPTSFGNAPTIINSPYGINVSSSDRFERLMFNKPSGATSATVGLRISFWSAENNERHQIDRVSCAFGGNTGTSTTNGACFKIGDLSTGGGGNNAFNIIFINPYWYGASIGIDSQSASFLSLNGQSNFTTIDYKINGGSAHIIAHRTEFQRQFLVAGGAHVVVDGSGGFIGNGAWNASYPLIYADTSILTLNDVSTSDQAGIVGIDANLPQPSQLILSNPSFGPSLTMNYQNFSQGVSCPLCAQRVGLFLGGQAGVGSSIQMQGTNFDNLRFMFNSKLSTQGNGTLIYCQDCVLGSNPCKGGGTGAFAKRINGGWNCQ